LDEILLSIRDEWAWAMPPPRSIVAINKFGNVLVSAEDGSVWRVCPEDVSCKRVLARVDALPELMADAEFSEDWEMTRLVMQAEEVHGVQPEGRCFCLKLPAVLGGEYAISNIGTIAVAEAVAFAGDLGRQIEDVPDGATIKLRFSRRDDAPILWGITALIALILVNLVGILRNIGVL
jgi:hypothetical protein